jgi:tetratricopeptide (TPR) repeat protein
MVNVWKDRVVIPTYEVGTPEKYPVFLEKRVYQASSGAVYPHPVIEQISDERTDKEWEVVFLENDYIKIMVLPALGGRIQMAYDKVRERHFVYYNHVIKPALVGLTGPWISGGIEFNWPQHHRPSTYDPVDYTIKDNEDGSKTVWVSEVERMFRTKGMAGFTLYPDKAYLEINVQLYNRTPHPQTFLWWANPAVAVNDHYQSVFPPDVNAVFDHGKRDVSEFPIARGEYYKVNYAPGTDISRYKNIPVPTSYMAITSEYDFVGGYENDTRGGLLHVADHHVSPGKKQWTWGNGDFGHAWDRNLTDSDGPYIELMCGVYTDNQPDFSWMHPYEEKSFRQYFMPYHNVGVVKNATQEALLNLELDAGQATVKIHVTAAYPQCTVRLASPAQVFLEETVDMSPTQGYEKAMPVGNTAYESLTATLTDCDGNELVAWSPGASQIQEIPEPAKAAKLPQEIKSVEELYLQGQHLEQYRHATFDATDYYREALDREPGDVRSNNALGLWYLKRGQFAQALPHFEQAIATLTQRNPNPYDSEAYFNKGVVLGYLGRKDEAYAAFFKSCWNAAWQSAGYFHLARIDAARGKLDKALELVEKSLIGNWHHHQARHLKIILLRRLGRNQEAQRWVDESLAIDPFNFGALYERYLLSQAPEDRDRFKTVLRDYAHNYIECSLDYAHAGQWEQAIALLTIYAEGKTQTYPMVAYFLGWYYEQQDDETQAGEMYRKAREMPPDYCFPNRLEEVVVLQAARTHNAHDARAAYYLGNFWYAARQYEAARQCWEASAEIDDTHAITHRNLALLYFNKTNQKDRAREHLEQAFSLNPTSARLLMELDQLYQKINAPVEQRWELLERNGHLTHARDDLYLEWVTLHNFRGNFAEALHLLQQRRFHPWEGGEGKVPFQYVTVRVELAKAHLRSGEYDQAVEHLRAAQQYPPNLGEGKLFGAQENDIYYWLGEAYAGQDQRALAQENWEKAAQGLSDPTPAIFYNDQAPDKIFYQGLALLRLGRKEEAEHRFRRLIDYGEQHRDDEVKLDYFAISLPDLLIWEEDLNVRNTLHCYYLIGLGELGLGNTEPAEKAFQEVLHRHRYHLPAYLHLALVKDQLRTVDARTISSPVKVTD